MSSVYLSDYDMKFAEDGVAEGLSNNYQPKDRAKDGGNPVESKQVKTKRKTKQ